MMSDNHKLPLTFEINGKTESFRDNPDFARAVSLVMESRDLRDNAAFRRGITAFIERPRPGLVARLARLLYRLTGKWRFYRAGYARIMEEVQ